jgi:hypothetical protein
MRFDRDNPFARKKNGISETRTVSALNMSGKTLTGAVWWGIFEQRTSWNDEF